VNVDQTTYGFSPKVLDRAMVLEFDVVDLDRLRSGGSGSGTSGFVFPETLPPFRLATAEDYAALPEAAHTHLSKINYILEEARSPDEAQHEEHKSLQQFACNARANMSNIRLKSEQWFVQSNGATLTPR
jgi:hypothetical protein